MERICSSAETFFRKKKTGNSQHSGILREPHLLLLIYGLSAFGLNPFNVSHMQKDHDKTFCEATPADLKMQM